MAAGTHNLGNDELLALLRDASLRPESICEEIECAGAAGCSARSIAEARTLLETAAAPGVEADAALSKAHAEAIAALPALLGGAVLRAAADAGRQEVLLAVATGANKSLSKDAKRELQRLKQRGVKIAELAPQGAPVVRSLPDAAEAPACFASSIDAYGERAVWYAKTGRGGVELAQIVLSDVKGILSADGLGLSRRQLREFLKRLPRGGVVTVVEVPPAHARLLIAEAEAEGARNGFSPPQSYAQALRILGPAPEGTVPHPAADLDFGPDGELPHQLAAAALFTDPLFVAWIPEEEALRDYAAKVDAIAQSALYADEAQKQKAREQAAESAAEAFFTPQRKARYARRLLEMAHVLRGEKRLDAARAALAVSRALAGQGGTAQPFCTGLFAHALEATGRVAPGGGAHASPPAAAPAPSLIIP